MGKALELCLQTFLHILKLSADVWFFDGQPMEKLWAQESHLQKILSGAKNPFLIGLRLSTLNMLSLTIWLE